MESILLFLIDHFPDLLDVNLTASIVILFVICVRQFMKGAPKIFSYALWAIVLLRLLVPVSIESPMSFVPERTELSTMVEVNDVLPRIEFEAPQDRADNEWHRENTAPGEPLVQTYRSLDAETYLTFAWLIGIAVMLLRSIVSYWKLRRKLKVVIPFRQGIFIADNIDTPFVMGFFRPKIYLPGTLVDSEREYIIAHERHHIRRGDHIFKALGFLALTIHWFNPLVWAAFVLAGRDMEMSCDEAVIRKLGEDVRAEYSASLLNLATGHRMFAGTPLAFGEGNPTGRVRNLAKWKKPAFWVILICLIVCIALAVCLLTDPEMPFPSEFEQYFVTDEKAELLSGASNEEYADANLTIRFNGTSGPLKINLELWYQESADSDWVIDDIATLETQEHCTFRIPSGCTFAIAATAEDGKNGYTEFAISKQGDIAFDKFEHDFLTSSNTKSSNEEASAWTVPEAVAEIPDAQDWGITMFAEEATQSSIDLCISLDEQSVDGSYHVGETYHLYLWYDKQWEELSGREDESNKFEPAAVEQLTPILPGTPLTYTIDFDSTFGRLSPGKYKIQLNISRQTPGEFPTSQPIFAEFTIPGDEVWAVTIQAHDVTPESLVLTYHNTSETTFYRLPGYTLRQWVDNQWIDLDVGKTWHETTEQVDFEHQSQPGNGMYIEWDGIGTLPQGQYLIGQEFCTTANLSEGQRFTVYASFEINEGSGRIKTLEELPEVYSAEQAMIDGCLVSRDGEATDNIEAFREFVERCNRGEAGFFRIVDWYYGENSHYFASDINYDGRKYTISWLEDGRRQSADYLYLKHFTGEKERDNIAYDAYEHYVLVNDNDVTWLDIWDGLISSQYGAAIDHMTIFSDYIYYPKEPQLPDKPDYAILEFQGSGLVTVLDGDRLEKLIGLFENGEYLGYEPKTHSIGQELNLIFASAEGDFIIELDPDSDLCRINGEYVWYGRPDEPDYINKLWEYLGITQWPDLVYMVCENALRS